jgi:hypothetical protein
VRDHLADARSVIGTPVLLGEFGKLQPIATRDDYFFGFYGEVLASLAPGASRSGALCWILYHDAYADYDGFGVYYPSALHATTTALLHAQHAAVKERVAPAAGFRRGDFDCDGAVAQADAVATLNALFANGAPSCCWDAADANDDGAVDLSDALYGLLYLYLERSPPPPPFPDCGADPTAEELELGCEAPACR